MAIEPKIQPAPDTAAASNTASMTGMVDTMTAMTHRNAQLTLEAAQAAVRGCDTLSSDFATFARESSERSATAFRAMTAATTPKELFELQVDFARQHFSAVLAEMAKATAAMVQTAREAVDKSSHHVG